MKFLMNLDLMDETFHVFRFGAGENIPPFPEQMTFFSITKTPDEISVVATAEPLETFSGEVQRDFRALRVQGPLDFALTGVLQQLLTPLAQSSIPVFALSTYDTDYILVRTKDLNNAIQVLEQGGHQVVQ